MKILLFFYPLITSFISKDIRLLSDQYIVKKCSFFNNQKIFLPWLFIKQFIFLIRTIYKADALICKFAGYHSLLPLLFAKIFNKPGIIITGGSDCAYLPDINYGVFTKFPISWFASKSYKLATSIVSVHESLIESEYTYDKSMPLEQGYQKYTDISNTDEVVIHNGYNSEIWRRNPDIKRPANSFLTVLSNFEFAFNYKRKGIDVILKVSKLLPECDFTIIGIEEGIFNSEEYKNINFIPNVPNKQLQDIYSAHSFYLQLSLFEGFPNALCEAMLCECVPIVSNVGGNADIVDDTGFILKHKNIKLLYNLLKEALNCDIEKMGLQARKRIATYYPESKRKKELTGFVNKIVYNKALSKKNQII